jgi:DNA-binding MarR family transcriptional regulator
VSTTDRQDDPLRLLSRAELHASRRLAAALEAGAAGATVEQWRALNLLADGAGHTMTELADYVLAPAPTATKLIDRLVADNLVYRHPDPADRRRVLVHLTDRGRARHRQAAEIVARIEREVFAGVPEGLPLADQLAALAEATKADSPGATA